MGLRLFYDLIDSVVREEEFLAGTLLVTFVHLKDDDTITESIKDHVALILIFILLSLI